MNGLLRIFLFLLLFAAELGAQPQPLPASGDTVKEGTLHIRRQPVPAFYKVEYVLMPALVRKGDTLIYDLGPKFSQEYPGKDWEFATLLPKMMEFGYAVRDTPHTDTVGLTLFINKGGRATRVYADSAGKPKNISPVLYDQLVQNITECSSNSWNPGGYRMLKRFGRKGSLNSSHYFCMMTIIVSSRPMTEEQKRTGVRFSNDIDLTMGTDSPRRDSEVKTPRD